MHRLKRSEEWFEERHVTSGHESGVAMVSSHFLSQRMGGREKTRKDSVKHTVNLSQASQGLPSPRAFKPRLRHKLNHGVVGEVYYDRVHGAQRRFFGHAITVLGESQLDRLRKGVLLERTWIDCSSLSEIWLPLLFLRSHACVVRGGMLSSVIKEFQVH